jgi:[protein-PII] uridylyltransferase
MLDVGREKAFAQHRLGSPGMQVSTLLADLYDDVVLEIWHEAVAQHGDDDRLSGLALVAHGGFGRRDLAPYSDADLMLLSTRGSADLAAKFAGNLTRDLSDCGIDPGLSIRSPAEACSLSWTDAVVFSSLTESRFLAGGLQLYRKFFDSYRHGAKRRSNRLIKSIVEARREERSKWGETNYLLRPNVKRSRGALRDIQLIRWIGFARFGETDLERLLKLGALPEEDFRLMRNAYGFMLRVRHELHFRSGKSQDILDRPTQLEIAKAWGYQGTEGVLPVEQFMQDYFDNTRNVLYSSAYFVDDAKRRSLPARLTESVLSKKVDDNIRMGPTSVWVRQEALKEFSNSLPDVLGLMSLANEYTRWISHHTWQAIRNAMRERRLSPPDDRSIESFLSLLSRPGRLADLLRRLHELRIIEQLIPEFERMRGLLQFNAYHKYTVDAHSILAVQAATDLQDDQESGMGRRYRRIENKRLLHLALLIHDIGKGYEEDHCIVGERIAEKVASRLNLSSSDSEMLRWLVLKHLIVNVVAFRHDLSDPQIVLSFAAEVGSIRRLEMLVVHTYCDLTAVGPGVATQWKLNLIEDLYRRTRRYFDSGDLPGSPDDPEIEITRKRVDEQLTKHCSEELLPQSRALLSDMPLSLLSRCEADSLAAEIMEVGSFDWDEDRRTICLAGYDNSVQALRFVIIRRENHLTMGTFARATAALAANGFDIQRAQIETVGDFAWDYFWVVDSNVGLSDEEPDLDARTIDAVSNRVRDLIDATQQPMPKPPKTWSTKELSEPDSVNVLPKKVVFDNESIDRYTIISLFAYNQVGLLSRIALAMSQQKLNLAFAKIDTHLDQVADVFYVSEQDGSKLIDLERQEAVRQAMLEVVSEG